MGALALKFKDYRKGVMVEQGHLDTAAKIALEKVYVGLFEKINKKRQEVDFVGEFCGIRVLISLEYEGIVPIISMAAYSEYIKDKHCKLFAYVNDLQPNQKWWFGRMLHHDEHCTDISARIHELTSSHNINEKVLNPYWERLMQLYNQGFMDLF